MNHPGSGIGSVLLVVLGFGLHVLIALRRRGGSGSGSGPDHVPATG